MNDFGRLFRVSIFGESHGGALGVVVDGCPAGLPLSPGDLADDLRVKTKLIDTIVKQLDRPSPIGATLTAGSMWSVALLYNLADMVGWRPRRPAARAPQRAVA